MHDYTFEVRGGKKVFANHGLREEQPRTRVFKEAAKADVSVIIPVFEREEALSCIHYIIESLQASHTTAHLAVIDQSFTPSVQNAIMTALQAEALSSTLATVIYHHDVHLTISTAKNQGVTLLRQHTQDKLGRLLVFIDSDIYVPHLAFQELLQAVDLHGDISAFGFPSVWQHNEEDLRHLHDPDYMRSLPPNKPEEFILAQAVPVTGTTLLQVPAIHGCLFAIRPEVFNERGGFHPFFAMHGEHVELSAWLGDNGHALAYISHLPLLHDDRDTLQYSVMRNLPGREKFLVATIIAMIARNNLAGDQPDDRLFTDIIRQKWLPNVGLLASAMEPAVDVLLRLGRLLHNTRTRPPEFHARARSDIITAPLDEPTRRLLGEAITYIHDNAALLATLFVRTRSPRQPLYQLAETRPPRS